MCDLGILMPGFRLPAHLLHYNLLTDLFQHLK